MADVKVPALLHKMSKAAQKAWYKKRGMEMPSGEEGKSAAAAKKVKAEPRKKVDVSPQSIRALNAARQKKYYEKGGRQPIGAGGSGGHSAMAGVDQSTVRGIKAGIKAGINPKVALVRYTNEETVDEATRLELIKRAGAMTRIGKGAFLAKVNARAAQLTQQKQDNKITKSKVNWGMSNEPIKLEDVQIDEVTKKEAETALGGPVKEKPKMPPGKQPAGYRYVRNLARKAMKQGMKEEVEQVVEQDDSMEKKEMAQTQLHFIKYAAEEILAFIDMGGEVEEWYQNKLSKVQSEVESLHSYIEGEKRRTGMVKEEEQIDEVKAVKAYDKEGKLVGRYRSMDHAKQMKPGHTYKVEEEVEQVDEKAPPGAKYERMVKHIKKGYAKGGLTPQEKSIAYATAWKAYGKKEEVEQTDEAVRVVDRFYPGTPHDPQKRKDVAATVRKIRKDPDARGGMTGFNRYQDFFGGGKARLGAERTPVGEEVVTEAEGTVAVTPKEKALAAHHGDPKKITYGDVIKARLKSAAAKKMGK